MTDLSDLAKGLSEAQRNAIHWLSDEWFEPFNRDMQKLMWAVDAVLLRPAIIEHREVRTDGEPPAHEFRLSAAGLALQSYLRSKEPTQ